MRYVNLFFNLQSMKVRDSPRIGILITKDDTSKFVDVTDKQTILFVEFDYIVEVSGMTKKRINLYLFRHPEIKTQKL